MLSINPANQYSSHKPAFTANLKKIDPELKKVMTQYAEKDLGGFGGVILNYRTTEGKFNSKLFFNHLKEDFNDEVKREPGYYTMELGKKVGKRFTAILKYFNEKGQEIKDEGFNFNPTKLFAKPENYVKSKRPNTMDLFNDRNYYLGLTDKEKTLFEKHNQNYKLF